MSPADVAKLILERDQYRVNSIRSSVLLKREKKKNTDHAGSSLWSIADHHSTAAASTLPAYTSAKTIDAGNYVVPVGIGSPKTQVSLAFDTLSSLTWTQCQPCAGRCFKQSEPIFEPNESFTYANISCSSQVCSDVERTTGRSSKCDISTCVYVMSYADQVFSAGYLARERLTLSSDVFNSFLLGCGQSNGGFTEGLSGVLGLGRDKLSIVSQTARKYESIFSYCLPSSTSLTGFLSFGVTNVKRLRNVVRFTPLISDTRFYGVDMTGISVGGRDLQISRSVFSRSGGMAIDPVTAITRLPPRAYQLLRSEFRQALSSVYPEAPGTSLLDTCFDLRRYRGNTVPKIRFYFDGDVEVELDFSAIFFLVNNDASRACLAFAATDRDTDFAIFGNMQQRTLEVVFDVPGERVGFGASGCK
ncbi:Aspartic peptidase [Trema orientale]|uniref:Aspartic peptidase n=1 Tax=Trema orientale TaxID=63057 RepID=A0A2P5F9X5_TREOI|nr:Aspartic peptidase [Trema orientale]